LQRGLGASIRTRPVGHVLAELEAVVRSHRPRSMHFSDDIFGLDIAWLREFAPAYKARIGLPFQCMQAPNLMDDERIGLLVEAGCAWAGIGIDSGSARVRRELLDRPWSVEADIAAAKRMQDRGIRLRVNAIVGFPGETLDEMLETLDACRRIRPWLVLCHTFTPYPGTKLADRAVQAGLLDGGFEKHIPPSFNRRSLLSLPHAWEVENLQVLAHFLAHTTFPDRWTRRVLALPPNPAFKTLYFGWHAGRHLGSGERGMADSAHEALHNLRYWFL